MTKRPSWSRLLALLATGTILAAWRRRRRQRRGSERQRQWLRRGNRRVPDGDSVLMAMPYEANQPAGENWRLGVEMAVAEINDDGGILGCQIELDPQDTQGDPDVSSRSWPTRPRTILRLPGHRVLGQHHREHGRGPAGGDPDVRGGRGAVDHRSRGERRQRLHLPGLVRRRHPADKFVGYMVDQGVESVDLIYKNDEFGAGGREAYVAAFEEAGIDVGLDIQVQPDQVDQSAEVTQLAGGDADASSCS